MPVVIESEDVAAREKHSDNSYLSFNDIFFNVKVSYTSVGKRKYKKI